MNHIAPKVGPFALIGMALLHWILLSLARSGRFDLWLLALPLVGVIVGLSVWAWWQQARTDRLLIVLLLVVSGFLFTPPAEHWILASDAGIYPNEGAFIARTGGILAVYSPLHDLPPAVRDLFFMSNREQYASFLLRAYQGILYQGYYIIDEAAPTLQISRMPAVDSWFALGINLLGTQRALYLTSLFAALALVLLYAVARMLLPRPFALWVTLLLALSYPQIHFGRAPYAEIFGQVWTLAGLWFALRWIQQRQPWLLVSALFFWVTTWSSRIDAILLMGGIGVLLLYLAYDRDRKTLLAVVVATPVLAGLSWWSANLAYVGATLELLQVAMPWFTLAFSGLLLMMLVAIALLWLVGKPLMQHLYSLRHWGEGAVLLGLGLMVLWATLPNPLRTAEVTRNYQEIIWFSSQYVTPLFYWLTFAGISWLCWRGYDRSQLFISLTFLSLALVFFSRYTSAPVYPVSLRRLLSDLFPLMALLAGIALAASWPLPGWKVMRWLVGVGALGWMLILSWPLFQQAELSGTANFIERFHAALPSDAVLIFEPQDQDSWVGWLASPLFSRYGHWALQLDSDTPELPLLTQAVQVYEASGRTVYMVSQSPTLPAALTPNGYTPTLAMQQEWRSSLIGQTRAPYPPPYWEFVHPVYVYELHKAP